MTPPRFGNALSAPPRNFRPLAWLAAILLLSPALLGGPGRPAPESKAKPEGLSPSGLAAMSAAMQSYVDRGELAGVVTLVARPGKQEQLKTYGLMDIEGRIPTRPDAIFRIASMTKVFTAVAALRLYEEGRFQLDDPVGRFLPELANLRVMESNPPHGEAPVTPRTVPQSGPVTVRDLLRHTAGFVYAFADSPLDRMYRQAGFMTWDKSLEAFVQRLAGLPLAYQPGRRWEYSYATDVLGRFIEVLTGQPLDVVLKEKVFRPLRMKDTDFWVPAGKLGRLASEYEYREGALRLVENARQSPFRALPAGLSGGGGWGTGYGGAVTTARDFGRFLQMLLDRGQLGGVRLLKPETVALMLTDHIAGITDRGFKVAGYGLGIGVETDPADPSAPRVAFWAGGPYNTCFFIDFRQKAYGIFLTQTGPFGHLDIEGKFRALFLDCAGGPRPGPGERGE